MRSAYDYSPYARTAAIQRPRPSARWILPVIVIACTIIAWAAIASCTTPVRPATNGPSSTPKSAWAQGNMPFLYQTDPVWANEPYGGDTIATYGCGPTCLSMVYVYLTGSTAYDPASMAIFSENNGYLDNGITAWRLMTSGAQQLGLSSEELPAAESTVRSALCNGSPVICSVVPGDFTKEGHFIVLAGINESGHILIRDPNSQERSTQAWELSRILGQCAALWAFSL